jgi:hypothetical protein
MKVSRSGFYDYLHSRSPHGGNSPGEAMMVAKIKEIFIEHRFSQGSKRHRNITLSRAFFSTEI